MKFILFYLPSVGTKAQIEKGFSGQNTQNYQNMLWQISQQVKAADEMGYWGMAFTEHHFHIEGFEESNNPILLGLYFGMQTKHLRIGEMANVLPFQNPLRLAEDLAMLDQMLRGRTFVGIARGYQKRWADTLGQTYHVGATFSDKSEMDIRNRNLFEDHYRLMLKAWTSQTFTHESEIWNVPPKGVEFPHDAVRKYGRGVDEKGMLTEIGIAPRPYQEPHPPIFQPFSFSADTFRFCAQENIVPFAINTCEEKLTDLLSIYREEAGKAGHQYALGQNVGIFRDCLVLRDGDEAHRWAAEGNGFVWPKWFGPMGFNEALRRKGEEGAISGDYGDLVDRGFEFVGNPDDVNRRIERMVKLHNPEYLLMWQYPGLVPHDLMMRHLELWATEIMPNWT